MNEDDIISRVRSLYPEAIIDVAGEDCSFELYIIDAAFAGMNSLQRQKPVLALFKDEITTGKLHALSVKAKTPMEQQGNSGLVQIQL
jgi:acid stress-induced BolA-like protein IbaG/YrbA